MFDSSLNPEQRADDLARLSKEHFDVLVIGGGINGVGWKPTYANMVSTS